MIMNQAAPVPKIDIVIVNWNSGAQLLECLASLINADLASVELGNVVVVDNASTDDSLQGIEDPRLPLRIVRNRDNRGFAAACNQGALEVDFEFLLFLNPDTILFQNSLVTPLNFMDRPDNADIGIIGIQLVDDNGRISRSCARFPTPGTFLVKMLGLDRLFPSIFPGHFMTEWDHGDSRTVDQVMGAFFLVRRSLFNTLGGLDERFFVYFEEVDFSLSTHKAGWRSYYLAEARAYHKGGGTSDQAKAARLYYELRSRILYCFKHYNVMTATAVMMGTLLIEPVARLLLGLARLSATDVIETGRGFVLLWGDVPKLLHSIIMCRNV